MLVLASNSPRRKELLSMCGWSFIVRPAHVDEEPFPGELPQAHVVRLARTKAARVAAEYQQELQATGFTQPASSAVILAADTIVVDGDQILGKPADDRQAEYMLRQLRSRAHQVYTALTAIHLPSGRQFDDLCLTHVTMRHYSDAEMLDYIASGDALDKAGAYAIQHRAFHPVESLQGCYTNVMGLPLCRATWLLQAALPETGFEPPVHTFACLARRAEVRSSDDLVPDQVICSFMKIYQYAL